MSLTVGKTEESWRKHDLVGMAHGALIGASSVSTLDFFRGKPIRIGIDFHAGDAKGVPHKQGDLFRVNESTTTPAMFERSADKFDLVLLCERDKKRQVTLAERFPNFRVIGDHAGAPDFVAALEKMPTCGVCVSDANGHGQSGIEHMAKLGKMIPRLDFVIVHPYGALMRHLAVGKNGNDTHHKNGAAIAGVRAAVEKYEWMRDQDRLDQWGDHLPSLEWAMRLGRKRMATTRVVNASANFRYRIIVVSNYLPQGILRNRMFQVIK